MEIDSEGATIAGTKIKAVMKILPDLAISHALINVLATICNMGTVTPAELCSPHVSTFTSPSATISPGGTSLANIHFPHSPHGNSPTTLSHNSDNTGPDKFSPPVIIEGTWLQKPIVEITKVNLSTSYNKLLSLLCKLEAAHKWSNKTCGFPKVNVKHPAQLTHWVQDGRGHGSPLVITNVPLYKKAWWAWWLVIQPSWCVLECPLVRTAHGDNWSS